MMPGLSNIDCLILAGGLGTRLAPAVPDLPKVLAPIDGTPFLSILLRWLARFEAHRVVLGLGYRADQVLSFLEYGAPDELDIVPVIEPEPLGTAGAVRFAIPFLTTDPILLINGDSFVDADLDAFVADHMAAAAQASILCTYAENADRFGIVALSADGSISAFREKEAGTGGLINAGVYLLSRKFLDRLTNYERGSLERDVFARMPPGTLHAHISRGSFIDIGTPEDFARAANILAPYLPLES